MTDFDFVTFERTFARLMTAYRLKLGAPEREEFTRTYFKILDAHPIEEVVAAGKRCIEKLRVFPKAADWLAEMASGRTTTATCPPDRRTMRVDEADELARAAALGYEDLPCHCRDCCEAGITRPIRYVPSEFGPDDLEQAFNPRRGVVEIVGHWAHGEELTRWYVARDAFFALAKRAPRTLFDAVAVICGEREPGIEG